jgi:hypothetical protein
LAEDAAGDPDDFAFSSLDLRVKALRLKRQSRLLLLGVRPYQ